MEKSEKNQTMVSGSKTVEATVLKPKTLEELKLLSKEELLKVVFDKSIEEAKEKGHAKYASS